MMFVGVPRADAKKHFRVHPYAYPYAYDPYYYPYGYPYYGGGFFGGFGGGHHDRDDRSRFGRGFGGGFRGKCYITHLGQEAENPSHTSILRRFEFQPVSPFNGPIGHFCRSGHRIDSEAEPARPLESHSGDPRVRLPVEAPVHPEDHISPPARRQRPRNPTMLDPPARKDRVR